MSLIKKPLPSSSPAFSLRGLWRACTQALGLPADGALSQKEIKCREMFTAVSGVDAAFFLEQVTAGLPPVYRRGIKAPQRHYNTFRIWYSGEGFSDWYDIDFRARVVEAGVLRSERGDRSTGRQMFAHRLIGAQLLGFGRLELAPMLETGGYVWAKAGVRITKEERRDLADVMERRLSQVQEMLEPGVYEHAARLVRLDQDGDLEDITRLSARLDNIRATWDFMQNVESSLPYRFREYMQKGLVQDRSMTLGQYLLFATRWQAYVDLRDARQMEKIERYTGVPVRKRAANPTPCNSIA